MTTQRFHDNRLGWFLLISLLLHLLGVTLTRKVDLFPASKEVPVYVEMREVPRARELDLPELPDQERSTPAKRLGPSERVAPRESAPRGRDSEDTAPPASDASRPSPAQQAKSASQEKTSDQVPRTLDGRPIPQPRSESEPLPRFDPSQLNAAIPIAAARVAETWRRKYREEVEEGETVWLDTEKDLLVSFFKRLRDNIYLVWNYPEESAARAQQGTCLLRITFNRDGTLARRPEVRESSGWPALDLEAVEAVIKAAPYGALPRAYPDETLSIFAFFQYQLGGRRIY